MKTGRIAIAGAALAAWLVGPQPAAAQFGTARALSPAQCTFNDECAQPLTCAAHSCRAQCRTDRDCVNGWVCQQQVWSNAGGDGNRNRFLEVYVPHSRIDSQPGVEAAATGEVRAVCVAPGLINPTSRVQPGPGGSQTQRPEPKKDPKAYLAPILQGLYDKEKQATDETAQDQKK